MNQPAKDGVTSDEIADDGVATDGVAQNGVASDGVATDGGAADGKNSRADDHGQVPNKDTEVVPDGVAQNGVAQNGVAQNGVAPSTDVSPQDPAEMRADGISGKTAVDQRILVNGTMLEKLPDDLFIPPDALEIFLETFQGPLDLLLYLIRKQNLDILDIPVAQITKQYMEYVELMRQFRLDLAAEYLVMAATLAEIKSRMLLPRPAGEEEDDEEDPRAMLIRRLQEYERFSQASRDIDDHPRLERDLYLVNMDFDDPAPVKVQPRASLNDLVLAFRGVVERTAQNKNWAIGHERLTVREKMTHILDSLRNNRKMRFEELFDPEEGRLGLVVCFMAILELARDNMLIVVQDEPFAPIQMKSIESE